MGDRPFIVGIGGTSRPESSSEKILRASLGMLSDAGCHTVMFSGRTLLLPMYEPGGAGRTAAASRLVEAVRQCDGLVIASPGYHGSVSGMVKNVLDYFEDLRDDERPYLHDRAAGCIGCAYGWQAAVSTLATLRTIVHALRGWPTPIGAAINSASEVVDGAGRCVDPLVEQNLQIMCSQMLDFTQGRAAKAA